MKTRQRAALVRGSVRHYERQTLTNFSLDAKRFRRLAFFLLIFTHVDIRLIALAVAERTHKNLTLDDGRALSVRMSQGTFRQHLNRVKRLLDDDSLAFAEEILEARNGFVHFDVRRFKSPHYHGKDVTSDAGYEHFMTDAALFDVNVPFPRGLSGPSSTAGSEEIGGQHGR
jgi:hypothetical protein